MWEVSAQKDSLAELMGGKKKQPGSSPPGT